MQTETCQNFVIFCYFHNLYKYDVRYLLYIVVVVILLVIIIIKTSMIIA